MSDRIIGIDLGTSNTVVAVVDDLDRVRVLADAEGSTVHPSVVSFHPSGGVVVGVKGKQRKVIDPQNTVYSAKRMIGLPFASFAVTETARRVPFTIKEGPNEQAIVATRSGDFAIPEISAIVLDHARKIANTALETEVSRAVVTVPASFTDGQRAATANAGALAGLTVVRVLNEPTAAALAYGSTKRLDEIIAVYDYGGGTFDITILKLEDQVYTVLGTSGDAFLGGEDMDERIVERMTQSFLQENRVDLRDDNVAMMRLRTVAEHTKIELSKRSRAVVKIEEIAYAVNGSPLDLTLQITRDELISSVEDLVDRTFVSCKEAMALANITQDRIADVLLVGGITRIPFVRDQVARFFGKAPRWDINPDDAIATGAALQASSIEQMLTRPAAPAAARRREDPARAVARADAFFGDLFGDKAAKPVAIPHIPASDDFSIDVADAAGDIVVEVSLEGAPKTPPARRPARTLDDEGFDGTEMSIPSIRLEDIEEPEATPDEGEIPIEVSIPSIQLEDVEDPPTDPLAPRSGSLELDWAPPGKQGRLKTEPSIELDVSAFSHEVDAVVPMAVVPIAALPVSPRGPAAVIDVTPRGLGIATVAGFCEELIRRNSQLPAAIRKSFVTSRDAQETVRIVICQGESRRLESNLVIGDLVLLNLPRRARGETRIDVEFVLDASGILQVSARDAATGAEQRAKLDLKGGMRPEELEAASKRLRQLGNVPLDL